LIKVGRSFWVVVFLLIICIIAANIPVLGETQLYYRLTYVWAILLSGSWLWSLFSLRRLRLVRQARTRRQQVGQVFEERLEILNESRLLRLWVEIHDESSLPGSAASRVLTMIGGRQSRSYLAYTWLNSRGLFKLGPTKLISGDIFGLFRATREISTNENLLVVPYMVDLVTFPSPHGLLPGGKAVRQRTIDVTPYAAGVREYVPGDSLNRIHWPTTVRRDRLMVKEFDEDPRAEAWIFIDAQKDVHAVIPEEIPVIKGEFAWLLMRKVEVNLPSSTIEYSVSIAASIANFFVGQGQEVGLAYAGQVFTILTAERGERQMGKILENLALLQPEGDLPFLGLVTAQENHLAKGSTVVMITPSISEGIGLAANELSMRSMHPVVILIDPSTFGGVPGSMVLEANLQSQGIPVIRVSNHENLKSALEREGKPSVSSRMSWWNDGNGAN
jgi:uncharacterized protein (DUF58 family)